MDTVERACATTMSCSHFSLWNEALTFANSTQIYVEAEARMDTYEVDGQKRTSLNLLQRESHQANYLDRILIPSSGSFEALQRPAGSRQDSGVGEEAQQAAAGAQ